MAEGEEISAYSGALYKLHSFFDFIFELPCMVYANRLTERQNYFLYIRNICSI